MGNREGKRREGGGDYLALLTIIDGDATIVEGVLGALGVHARKCWIPDNKQVKGQAGIMRKPWY